MIECELEMAAFVRAEARRCDETIRALVVDVEDLMVVLGEMDVYVVCMWWLWVICVVVSLVCWDCEWWEARKVKAKARRLAT